jgi:hypothetical protein
VVSLQCHGFRLSKQEDYFQVIFDNFVASFIFKAAETVAKIGFSLKQNHHYKFLPIQAFDNTP